MILAFGIQYKLLYSDVRFINFYINIFKKIKVESKYKEFLYINFF